MSDVRRFVNVDSRNVGFGMSSIEGVADLARMSADFRL